VFCEKYITTLEPQPTLVSAEYIKIENDEFEPVMPRLGLEIPGLTFSEPTKTGRHVRMNFIGEYISAMYRWLIGVAVVFAVVMIIVSGIQYMLSGGSKQGITKLRENITNSLMGLALLLGSYMILYTINPQLTVLKSINVSSVSMVPINTENTVSDIQSLNLPAPPANGSMGTNNVPYFSQRAYENSNYGICGTVKTSGCGPTSMAMVLKYYKVNTTPPEVAANFAAEGYRGCTKNATAPECKGCTGTSHLAFTNSTMLAKNNLVGRNVPISNSEEIIKLLSANKPLIVSMGPSKFTRNGHFIVLTGIDSDGNILLNDPNSGYTFATNSEIFSAIKGAWLIEPKS
jgi:hypothetical protein